MTQEKQNELKAEIRDLQNNLVRKKQELYKLMNDPEIPKPDKPEDNKSKGLGDSIKKVTDKLGIKQCGGCKKRQDKLNRLFPYKTYPKKEE